METQGIEETALPGQRRFRVREYYRLAEVGILNEDERVELLEGVIYEVPPPSPPHAALITELAHWIQRGVSPEFRVRVQMPLSLTDESEPEPDLAVVTRHEQQTAEVHPRTALLVVEASGESLRRDRGIKRKLYARANVAEYWIAIVEEKKFEVYTDPDPVAGRFRTMKVVGLGEVLTPRAIKGVSIPVSALFEMT